MLYYRCGMYPHKVKERKVTTMHTKKSVQDAKALLEAQAEQQELQAAIDLRTTLFELYGSFPCHIYTHGKGITYRAMLMLGEENNTVCAVGSVEKFEKMIAFFSTFLKSPSEKDMEEMEIAYQVDRARGK